MERYITQTEGLLGLYQATANKDEMERSAKAGEEMWQAIREICDSKKLNVREMMMATLACHHTILEVANEEVQEVKKGLDL